METFQDSKGKTRSLSLTIGKARREVKALGIDFLDGDPTEIANDLMIRTTLQVDLVWALLDGREAIGLTQDQFEDQCLDGDAFTSAREAVFAEIENFILKLRPGVAKILSESIQLIRSQTMKSVDSAISLFQSTEMQEGFSQANADAVKKAKSQLLKLFSASPEDSESTPTQEP